jgi:hypothetical protein
MLPHGACRDQFDQERVRLLGYLSMAAERDLLNLLEKERRHLKVVPIDGVVLDALPRNNPVEEAIRRYGEHREDRGAARWSTR